MAADTLAPPLAAETPSPGWGRFGTARRGHYYVGWRSLCARRTRRRGQEGSAQPPAGDVCGACKAILAGAPLQAYRRRRLAGAELEVLNPHQVLRLARTLRDFCSSGTLSVKRGLFADLVRLAERGVNVVEGSA